MASSPPIHGHPAEVARATALGPRPIYIRPPQDRLRRYDGDMRRWRPLTPEQLKLAEERLRNPAPGSRIEAAQRFGIDLTLIIGQLRLTPTERASNLQMVANCVEQIRGSARKRP